MGTGLYFSGVFLPVPRPDPPLGTDGGLPRGQCATRQIEISQRKQGQDLGSSSTWARGRSSHSRGFLRGRAYPVPTDTVRCAETPVGLLCKAVQRPRRPAFFAGDFFLRYIGSVEISLDDFGTNLEDMAVGWIDDHPQIVDIGCAKGFDAREAHQALARGRLAQRLVHAEIMGIAVG